MALAIKIKHAGKTYELEVDTTAPATVFKEQIYHKTGVPVDKVKVPVKGGMLKVCLAYQRVERLELTLELNRALLRMTPTSTNLASKL